MKPPFLTRRLTSRLVSLTVLGMLALATALASAKLAASPGDTTADRELGQAGFDYSSPISFVRARSLYLIHPGNPEWSDGIAIDAAGGHLYVSDFQNRRVLGWSSASTFVNGQDADIVIGSPNFFTPGACTLAPNTI